MRNIEIKARLRNRSNVEQRLEALGAKRVWTLRQKDTFFGVQRGWLKLREAEGRPAELIAYERSTETTGPRLSLYEVRQLKDAEAWKRLLGRVLSVDCIVEKVRTLWIYEHTRVHLDQVDRLGDFLELETVVEGIPERDARAETQRVLETLGIDAADLVAVPYRDLLAAVAQN